MIKKKLAIIIRTAGLIALGLAGLFFQSAYGKSPDAIAMRIISNPEHYSALRWYNEKVTVKGSPQLLSVDDYPAVRDGRSVYVSAANIENVVLYTNVYIISYNQEAEQATQDIFGQILAKWRFNTNLDSADGVCSEAASKICLTDTECGTSGFCSSFKARVTRDTVRMSRLMDLKASLESFKKSKGKYPSLSAGSYLPAKTVSVWPSWQESLGKDLGITPPIDPVNNLASCGINYDPTTCWDQTAKSFAWTIPSLPGEEIPADNLVFTYSAAAGGASYKLCGYSESSLMDPALRCSACVPNICADYGGPNSCGANGCGTGDCAPGCSGVQVCSAGSCVAPCVPTSPLCDGVCPSGCTAGLDPDCGCQDSNFCCGSGCNYSNDNNCPAPPGCIPDGCNGVCPAGCTVALDPDCGCADNNSCCGLLCTNSTDNDCPVPPCVPDCTGRVCGSDGCTGSCGSCTAPDTCNASGQCVAACTAVYGCQTSAPPNSSIVSCPGCCGSGSCYGCAVGSSWGGPSINTCGESCTVPDKTTCPGAVGPSPDKVNFELSTYNNTPTTDWHYTSASPKPSTWPATIAHGVIVAQADPASAYGIIRCEDGAIVKRYQYGAGPTINVVTCSASTCVDSDGDTYDTCDPGDPGDDGKVADCNDTAGSGAAINPGVAEICDNIDNNCQSGTDEDCDSDSDNYCGCSQVIAIGAGPVAVCPGTITTDASTITSTCDCDDIDVAVNPGALTCTPGANNNCNAALDCTESGCSAVPACFPTTACTFPFVFPCTF